jgi:hypothetical protein
MSRGGWIKWWKDTANDPRLIVAAEKLLTVYEISRRSPGGSEPLSRTESLDFLRNAVTGALQTLWCNADDQLNSDDILRSVSLQSVDAIVHLEGFVAAMPREWLTELDDGRVMLPGYSEKNSLIIKKKRALQSHARVKRYRERRRTARADVGNGVTVTHVTTLHRAVDIDKEFKRESASAGDSKPRRRRAPLAPLPDGFALTEPMRAFALKRAANCDVEAWFEHFCAHHRAKGSYMHDWQAAWRTWVSHGARFGYPRKQEAQGAANGLPVLNG